MFRQQYSKIGNTREQLFHAWRSFHFDENTETVDAFVICIRQVATLLGYGESQILEVFKKHTTYKIVLGIISHRKPKRSSRNSKKNINKGKDRQLARQSSSTPFMSVKDNYNKKVTFNTWDRLEDKIDKLTVMMGKWATGDDGSIGNSNLRCIRAGEEDKVEIFMTHIIMTEEIAKIDIDKIVVTEEMSIDRIKVEKGMNKIIGDEILEAMPDHINISIDETVEENTEVTIGVKVIVEE